MSMWVHLSPVQHSFMVFLQGGLLTYDKSRVERVKAAMIKFMEKNDPKASIVAAFRFYRNHGIHEVLFPKLLDGQLIKRNLFGSSNSQSWHFMTTKNLTLIPLKTSSPFLSTVHSQSPLTPSWITLWLWSMTIYRQTMRFRFSKTYQFAPSLKKSPVLGLWMRGASMLRLL